mmetsp:Transcript_21314/g.59215  ORF Transcript_21314/g.59215 Transcript_21314/m.59215 type:complete len:92 (-) Transcript_21314:6-281(-)
MDPAGQLAVGKDCRTLRAGLPQSTLSPQHLAKQQSCPPPPLPARGPLLDASAARGAFPPLPWAGKTHTCTTLALRLRLQRPLRRRRPPGRL